jgi:NADPH:quinone reductase-like Zn-dependent oxidoreductase
MSQLSLTVIGDLDSIRLSEPPADLLPDQVRVALAAAPVNHSDLLVATAAIRSGRRAGRARR